MKMKIPSSPIQCNNDIRRYDIWLADIPKQENSHVQCGRRPIVIVSNEKANRFGPIVSVVPLTSKLDKKSLPTHVFLSEPDLREDSIALCEHVNTVDKRCLIRYLGSVKIPFNRLAIQHGLMVQLDFAA